MWLVDQGTFPPVREEFGSHLAATMRAAELERAGVRHVVCWELPDECGPWVEAS